ncbi:hypothetical protein E2C01_054591 [Portunus trituberculatus]|uniref:Uncharacterized protein n=1 Tax=Portunus trituberculatus TaxID=210409 RepID=A0A5B7GSH4_PORTR|nr:hypothetical protein [Portunus trituberculatus]
MSLQQLVFQLTRWLSATECLSHSWLSWICRMLILLLNPRNQMSKRRQVSKKSHPVPCREGLAAEEGDDCVLQVLYPLLCQENLQKGEANHYPKEGLLF